MTITALRDAAATHAAAPSLQPDLPAPLISAPPEALRDLFPHRPFATRHALASHPLLTLPRLAQLVQELPRDLIEYNSGNAAIDQNPDETPSLDLDPVEIVRRIETCGAWMVLKRVEKSPAYRALLEEALMSVARALGHDNLEAAGFTQIEGFIFVSSPNTTTPFHLDSEDNFFVQIHGEKFFHVYDNRDYGIADEREIERAMTRHRNLRFDAAFEPRLTTFRLVDGDGCFIPYQWPHWLRTGQDHSISMAITWKTEAAKRNNDLHFANSILRKIGLPQRPPGHSPPWDSVKLAAFRAGWSAIQPLRSSETLRKVLRRIALGKNANYYYGKD